MSASRNRIAARLSRWLGGLEKKYQERIAVFGVITGADGYRARESLRVLENG